MGLFDSINCKYPLPIQVPDVDDFQTKDTPAQYMDRYEIRADGTLWHQEYDIEDRSKAGMWLRENPGKTSDDIPEEFSAEDRLCGCMSRVNLRWVQVEGFTGEVRFYDLLGDYSTGWVEFSACFNNGKVSCPITLIEHREPDPKEEAEAAARLRKSLL